jgi:hypothetical protein
VLNPSVCHFVLTAGNESRLARTRAEIPLATVCVHIV